MDLREIAAAELAAWKAVPHREYRTMSSVELVELKARVATNARADRRVEIELAEAARRRRRAG